MLTATNAITIKDTPERIAAAGAHHQRDRQGAARSGDRRRAARSRSHAAEGIRAADRVARQPRASTVRSTSIATSSRCAISATSRRPTSSSPNLPGLYYRLLKTDSATRVLANPQLRTSEGIAAQARFGERVPVPVTTFAPIAAGGVQTQPITSFNYENIGVNIDITPRTHHDDDVSLAVKIEVSSISGTGLRRPADVRQPRDQHRDPAEGRRDQHARRPHPRRRAPGARTAFPA